MLVKKAGRPRRVTCRVCGRHVSEVGTLSARGKCQAHGLGHAIENVVQLNAHRGPRFDHWRKQCLAAFGVTVDTDER